MTTSTTSGQRIFMRGRIAGVIFHWKILMWHSPASAAANRKAGLQHTGKSRRNPPNVPFPVGDVNPYLIHSSLGTLNSVRITNRISVGSAVFAGLIIITDRETDRSRYSICRNRPRLCCGLITVKRKRLWRFMNVLLTYLILLEFQRK